MMSASPACAAAPVASAVSDKKLDANRRNAAQSTGPRSPEGKARVSYNAIAHGLFSSCTVLPGESRALYVRLRMKLIEGLRPADAVQFMLAEQVVNANWRLRRLQESMHLLHVRTTGRLVDQLEDDFAFEDRSCRRGDPAPDPAERQGDLEFERHPAHAQLVQLEGDDAKESAAYERCCRHEHRIQGMILRLLRQLDRLQNPPRRGRPRADEQDVEPDGALPRYVTYLQELLDEDVAQDEMRQDEMRQDEMRQDEVCQDEVCQDEQEADEAIDEEPTASAPSEAPALENHQKCENKPTDEPPVPCPDPIQATPGLSRSPAEGWEEGNEPHSSSDDPPDPLSAA